MKRLTKKLLLLVTAVLAVASMGFSLIGPFKNGPAPNDWQAAGFGGRPAGLGYTLAGDIGGPMTPLEGYRWNTPFITYAFDESFIRYFGQAGVAAVSNAFQILNDLPPFSSMSQDLSEFPWDSKQDISFNQQFGTLGLVDLKSMALSAIIEQLGLAKPERFVYGLRGRTSGQFFTNYTTVLMNYDPVSFVPSRYVNGVLYHYQIFDALGPVGGEWASAVEFAQSDPFFLPYSAVAGGLGSSDFELLDGPANFTVSGLLPGQYFVGLTRDDIGGLRYLYGTNNLVTELLLTNVTGTIVGDANSPWQPFLGNTNTFLNGTNTLFSTNSLGTNLIAQGIRPGVNKLFFKQVSFDSLLGQTLIPVTNKYTDTVITNGRPVIQAVQRASVQPDFLFLVQDLGLAGGAPISFRRSNTAGWQNNDLLNGFSNLGGPGVIQPTVQIFFSDQLPYFSSSNPGFLDDVNSFASFIWSSFDGSTNAPAIYPHFPGTPDLTVQDLQTWVLSTH
jgi:hypothetical protein